MKKDETSGKASYLVFTNGLDQQNNQLADSIHGINPFRLESATQFEFDLIGGGSAIGYHEMAKPRMHDAGINFIQQLLL